MRQAWDEIKRLTSVNAKHRKGWRLGDISAEQELKDAAAEIVELACVMGEIAWAETRSGPIDELADVLGCLIGFADKMGWSMDVIEAALLKKLSERFTEEK